MQTMAKGQVDANNENVKEKKGEIQSFYCHDGASQPTARR
jgi:hypothetical protein